MLILIITSCNGGENTNRGAFPANTPEALAQAKAKAERMADGNNDSYYIEVWNGDRSNGYHSLENGDWKWKPVC